MAFTARTTDDELALVVYREDPVLLLFGDEEAGLARARAAAERAGCRIGQVGSIEDGEACLDRQASARAVVVIAGRPSSALDRLLVRVSHEGRGGRLNPIVVAPAAMIEAAVATGLGPEVEHLIDPGDDELAVAIALATAPAAARLHDVNRGNGAGLLQQLSEEAARLATMLASLSTEERGEAGDASRPPAMRGEDQVDTAFVRSIIRARRLRDQYFRGELFADPAWDMLLDLYAARLQGERVAVSSLCIAAAVPATTALRWIKALTDRGLLLRSADPRDGRRVYIELSDEIADSMGAYLSMAQRVGATII